MLGPGVVIAISVAAAVCILAVGSVAIVAYVRYKHAQIVRKHGLNMNIPAYYERSQDMSISGDERILQQGAGPRRSIQLPYGMAANGWSTLPAGNAAPPAPQVTTNQPDPLPPPEIILPPMRKRSLRNPLSAHSFSIPKTRRQKKIEKAIPLSQIPRSPLSAITERSGTNTTVASPALGLVELPTEITPKQTPDKDVSSTRSRPTSTSWPLPARRHISHESIQPLSHNITIIANPRKGLGPRSISMSSQASMAPDEPLPPLPAMKSSSNEPQRRDSPSRHSGSSFETVGTSVVASGGTPKPIGTGSPSHRFASKSINIHQLGLHAHDKEPGPWEPVTLSFGTPPGNKAVRSLQRPSPGLGSKHGSIGPDSLLNNANFGDRRTTQSFRQIGTILPTIDASSWEPILPRRESSRSRSRSGHRSLRTPSQRHSMFETVSSVSASPEVISATSPSALRPQRPSSVGAAAILPDGRSSSSRSSVSSISSCSESQKRGHKRQNCIRIANLPAVEISRRPSKLRLDIMTEEEEQEHEESVSPLSSTEKLNKIPGLELIDRQESSQQPFGNSAPAPSPFDNRPVLEPTSRRRPATRQVYSDDSYGGNRSDSDVFNNDDSGNIHRKPQHTNVFLQAEAKERQRSTFKSRDWQRLPTPPDESSFRGNNAPSTPISAVRALKEELRDQESPILPSPTLSSANLFSRTLHGHRRLRTSTGPNGPRSQALASDPVVLTISSRTTSPTPTRVSATTKATSIGVSIDASGQDLRKSAMMLRRMNSELREQRSDSYRSYRNLGDSSTALSSPSLSGFSDHDTPNIPDFPEPNDGRDINSMANIRMQMKSPSTADMLQFPLADGSSREPYLTSSKASGPLKMSRSRLNVPGLGHSTSVISTGGQSDTWEDASMRGDSDVEEDSRETPRGQPRSQPQKENVVLTTGYESFEGACEVVESRPVAKLTTTAATTRAIVSTPKGKKRQGGLLVPERPTSKSAAGGGYGLGLMGLGPSAWETPASLYDGDGFLRD